MKRIIISIILLMTMSVVSNAQTYSHKRAMTSSGGGRLSIGEFYNYGVVGEFAVCKVSGDTYNHYAGFLYGAPCWPTDIKEVDLQLPLNFELSQNYPNPFNPSTTIKYALPKPAHVRMNVYNLLGQKVETLVDERQDVGYHSLIWNAQNISSGVYFYRITTDDFTETKRMTLLK